MHITYQFSRTGMLTMECKVLQQLHNIISGPLYIFHTDYHCALADQSPTGTSLLWAVLSVSALFGMWGPSVPPPPPDMQSSGPALTVGLGQGRAPCHYLE